MKDAGRKFLYLHKLSPTEFDLESNSFFFLNKKKQAKSSYILANSPQRNSI